MEICFIKSRFLLKHEKIARASRKRKERCGGLAQIQGLAKNVLFTDYRTWLAESINIIINTYRYTSIETYRSTSRIMLKSYLDM